jgi:hypothetical protein
VGPGVNLFIPRISDYLYIELVYRGDYWILWIYGVWYHPDFGPVIDHRDALSLVSGSRCPRLADR